MNRWLERWGPWALVTGASSGIGAALARELASRGMHLVLVARRGERLDELAGSLREEYGIEVRPVPLDLARPDFLEQLEPRTNDVDIHLLINNAGIAVDGPFLDHDLEAEEQVLEVNVRAVMRLTHAYGRRMRERGRGAVVLISSISAYAGTASWSHYAATKAFELLLAESLAFEWKRHGVHVLAVAPGPVRTEFWPDTTPRWLPFLTAEGTARSIVRKIGRRGSAAIGAGNALILFATRLMPRRLNTWLFSRMVRWMKARAHRDS